MYPGSPVRTKFWEMDSRFKCPVVGMCLSPAEQKQLLKKVGIPLKKQSLFRIHEILVAFSDKETLISKKVNSFLNRKFSREIESMEDLDEPAFMERWNKCFESGAFEGALWVASTRRDLSDEAKHEIFGAVHMSMHWSASEIGRLRKQISLLKESKKNLGLKNKQNRTEIRELKRENRRLCSLHTEMERRASLFEKEKVRLEEECKDHEKQKYIKELEQRNMALKREIEQLTGTHKIRESKVASLSQENENLKKQLKKESDAIVRFREETREIIAELTQLNQCNETCPSLTCVAKEFSS
jgi:hypothetical protein